MRKYNYALLIDIRKAFDSVDRLKILEAFARRNIISDEEGYILRMLLQDQIVYLGEDH